MFREAVAGFRALGDERDARMIVFLYFCRRSSRARCAC